MSFYFNISLRNPFHKGSRWENDKLVEKEFNVSHKKAIEYRYGNPSKDILFSFMLHLVFSGHDHAGPELNIGILGWEAGVALIDHRHWNYDANRWNREDEY